MPLMIPTSRSPSAWKASCSPNPPTGVRSSAACVGLTVVTASANAIPPLRKFTRPYHSRYGQSYSGPATR